ncbi:MAG: hypothetical protein WCK86_22560 [Planctomycetia bacterium]
MSLNRLRCGYSENCRAQRLSSFSISNYFTLRMGIFILHTNGVLLIYRIPSNTCSLTIRFATPRLCSVLSFSDDPPAARESKTVKDIVESIQQAGAERLRNPIVGTFILAWSVSNWHVLATLLLGELPVVERIAAVESQSSYMQLLVIPFVATVVYVIGMPWLALLFDRVQASPVAKRKQFRIKTESALIEDKVHMVHQEVRLDTAKERYRKESEFEVRSRELELQKEEARLNEVLTLEPTINEMQATIAAIHADNRRAARRYIIWLRSYRKYRTAIHAAIQEHVAEPTPVSLEPLRGGHPPYVS